MCWLAAQAGKAKEAQGHETRADAHAEQLVVERVARQSAEHVLRQHMSTGAAPAAAGPTAAGQTGGVPLAVIGYSGAFAGSPDVNEFWRVCRDGADCITVGPVRHNPPSQRHGAPCTLRSADYPQPTADCRLQTADRRPQTADCGRGRWGGRETGHSLF